MPDSTEAWPPKRNRGRRRPDLSSRRRPDGDTAKRCPTGLTEAVLALQQYWLAVNGVSTEKKLPLDHKTLAKDSMFRRAWEMTLDRYKGVGNPPRKDVAGAVWDMAAGNSDMEYWRIRAIAEFTGLHSAGLFLLYTQLIGLERELRESTHEMRLEALLTFLAAVWEVMSATVTYLKGKKVGEPLLYREYEDTSPEFMPDLEVLKIWRDVFHGGRGH